MARVELRIEVRTPDGSRDAVLTRTQSCVLLSRFGAERSQAWVTLLPEDHGTSVRDGDTLSIHLDGAVRFRGTVFDIRTDTQGHTRGLRALREPRITHSEVLGGLYLQQSPTATLHGLLSKLRTSPLTWPNETPSTRVLDRLEFAGVPLFAAIDLLAKLSGNWIWDIGWDDVLRFRPHPPYATTDHAIFFDDRIHRLKVWSTRRFVYNRFRFHGGIADDNVFERPFEDGLSITQFGVRAKHLYARSITTDSVFGYLKEAVLEQLPHAAAEKYLDLDNGAHHIGPGDTLHVRGLRPPDAVADRPLRVAAQEIRINSENAIRIRLHLAQQWESSNRYHSYIDHDYYGDPGDYGSTHLGPFQLDYSALDSGARIE